MVLTYAGGGVSYLLAGLDDGSGTGDVESAYSAGAYVHCGVLKKVGRQAAVGGELRYTFGTGPGVLGVDADGIQLLFQFMFAHWP
jgi:hypothetical protein